MPKIKTAFEVSAFCLLTLLLYLLFILTLPFFREGHGLLVETGLSDITRGGFLKVIMFVSAGVCALLGAILLEWAPGFTAGLMANLWSVTYFFLWMDGVFALSTESRSLHYLYSLAFGVVFIYFFFFTLHCLEGPGEKIPAPAGWRSKLVSNWIWGWMGFYFGLSCLMIFDSFEWAASRFALAFGALVLSFLNYLLCLWHKRALGEETAGFSKTGRWFFTLWLIGLAFLGLAQHWAAD